MEVSPGTGAFHVTGKFNVDATGPTTAWQSQLKVAGEDLEWKGLRFRNISADAELASEGSVIHCEFLTESGSCGGTVTLPGGHDPILTFKGKLRDPGGRENQFDGHYQNGNLTVASLEGEADLLAIARGVPFISKDISKEVALDSFPHIHAINIRKSAGSPWTVESLEVSNSKTVGFTLDKRRLEADRLNATCAFDGSDWRIKNLNAKLMGGSITMKGSYRDGAMRQSTVVIEGIQVSALKWLANQGEAQHRGGIASGRFEGTLDFRRVRLVGFGTVHMDRAPIIEVPLLDQVYELFTAMIPGVEKSGNGEFDAEFKAHGDILEVTKFEARGGAALTVSARGTVDLDKQRVSGRARGKLIGLPGLLTSPLSRLLEMVVEGPYDNIRVKPLGPVKLASNAVSGTVGVPLDVLEETGKITGTLLKEGIRLPFDWIRERTQSEQKPDH
jgi:hypothetical protein